MLRVARAKLQHLPTERVELVQGDFAGLAFSDASFDTVLFHQVLHFAPDPAAALVEAARVLRPATTRWRISSPMRASMRTIRRRSKAANWW